MEEENLKKVTNIQILTEMNKLDDEIWYKIIRYNKLAKEMTIRFPGIDKSDYFKPKVLSIRR